MRTLLSTRNTALMLTTGAAQAAFFINDYDALLTDGADSDNTVEAGGWIAKRSLPLDFVPSIDLMGIGSVDHGGGVEIRRDGKACPLNVAQNGSC
jgi:hypothetical protein